MLAFIDSPIQLVVAMVVILLVFGPQKVPDIARQLGRALREFKRATSDFTSAMNLDEHPTTPTYDPPRYDSYGNTYSTSPGYVAPGETNQMASLTPGPLQTQPEPPRGDFAASALADASEDYGVKTPSPEDK